MPVILESNGEVKQASSFPANSIEQNRYTILTADPVSSYRVNCTEPLSSIYLKIRELKESFLTVSEVLDPKLAALPFQGGIAGYLGYPKICGKSQLQINDGSFGVYLWAIVIDHKLAQSCLAIHPNCSAEAATRIIEQVDAIPKKSANRDSEVFTNFTISEKFKAQTDYEKYRQAYERIKYYLEQGDCYQVNLTQKFSAQCNGNPFSAYMCLRRINPAPFSAFIGNSDSALLSLSPERFVLNRGGNIETKPIKGTIARSLASPEQDKLNAQSLLNSEKDRAENLMIVDLLRNDLGKIANIGSVQTPALFDIESFSNVHHLVSTVTASIPEKYDSIDLLSHCFPGGSITGAPKLRAMEVIEEVEVSDRGPYCGTVFYWASSGDFDSNIAIRSLHWTKGLNDSDSIHCWAGGGIVEDSTCDSEYQECFDKIQNLMSGLESQL